MSNFENDLLVEKYRPKSFDEFILPNRILEIFKNEDGSVKLEQNYIFKGSPGCGKTSLAKFIASNFDYIYLNASDENGIDAIREKVIPFSYNFSLTSDGGKKVVVLDEIDGVSEEFFKALRGVIQQFPNVRFIATCNYYHKIIKPIESRFITVDFDIQNLDELKEVRKKAFKRLVQILKNEGFEFENEFIIDNLIKKYNNDFRKIIDLINHFKVTNKTILKKDKIEFSETYFHKVLYEAFYTTETQFEMFAFIQEYVKKFSIDDVFSALFLEFVSYLKDVKKESVEKITNIILVLSDYQYKKNFIVDPFLSLSACVISIHKILKS